MKTNHLTREAGMSAGMTAITLTREEQELIENKREQENLEEKKKAAEKREADLKEIQSCKANIVEFKKESVLIHARYEEFLQKLLKHRPNGFVLEESTNSKNFQAKNHMGYDEDDHRLDDEILYNEDVDYQYYLIRCLFADVTITETEYTSRQNLNRYSLFGDGELFTFMENTKCYKSAKTVVTKIDEKLAAVKSREDDKKRSKEDWKEALEKVEEMYPEANCNERTEWVRDSFGRSHGYRGRDIKLVSVKFDNGFEIKYSFSRNCGKLVLIKRNMDLSTLKLNDVVNALSRLHTVQG